MAHIVQFAQEMGSNMNAAEVAEFLNHNGTAQNVWIHMMEAGEQYIKSSLKTTGVIYQPSVGREFRQPRCNSEGGRRCGIAGFISIDHHY
jgi:hypothetical protein